MNDEVPDTSRAPEPGFPACRSRACPGPLLLVTDRHAHARSLLDTIVAFLGAGGSWVWFRDRDLAPDARRRLAEHVAERVFADGGHMLVGGDIELAVHLGADGVHLGGGSADRIAEARASLGEAALVGISAHSVAEARDAAVRGADYVSLSPIHPTASKPDYGPALGLEAIRAAATSLPVAALGGITTETIGRCRLAGASACAVLGAVMAADEPGSETRRLLDAWHAAR